MVLETAATAAMVSAAKPLVKPFVEKFVTSKLQNFADWCKKQSKKVMIPKTERFQNYLERMYDKYSIINTLVFQNSQRKLKDVYIAQTIKKENDFEVTMIDNLPVGLIRKYKKILITDTAGMGKSTIMKRMFIDLIDNCQENVGIPIYIELNRLNKDRTIVVDIQEELNTLSNEFDNDLLLDFIQTGGFIFFLDGYDEISITDRKEVTDDIKKFISKAGTNNYYILTSRPEDSLASFGDFQSFKIQPLTKDEAFELLKRYDLSKNKVVSKNLIEMLKTEEYHAIDEYLENPLLVSLLFTAYHYKQTIPLKKHQFYRQVFNALFEAHKLAQGQEPHKKRSGLDIDDFNGVLRYVGYECLKEIGVRFDEDTILKSIDRAKEFFGNLKFGSSGFLKDLKTSVPLFIEDGTEYRWAHKSLMEYFAARFIADDAKEDQDEILTAIYNSEHVEKYINMLDIYFDIDFKGFSKNITLPLCERYLQFYKENYLVFNIQKELIEERISLLCFGEYAFSYLKKKSKHDVIIDFRRLGFRFGEFYSISRSNNRIFCFASNNNDGIINLLFRKMPSLFTIIEEFAYRKQRDEIKNTLAKMDGGILNDKIYCIDMETGNEGEEFYNAINEMITNDRRRIRFYINTMAVKKEVDRIKKETTQNHNKRFNLLSGI